MTAVPMPERIESYRLCRPLGAGGMGLVFEAIHEIVGTQVAIKLAAPHVRRDPALRARFLNEARALTQINHPGVVRILGCGQIDVPNDDPNLYIVMELLRGQSLRARLSVAPVSIEEVRQIGVQVAEALHEVHRHQLVHRDLKPENIMLVDGDRRMTAGRAKVIDFGIAKVPPATQSANGTAPGTQLETGDDASLGTPGYMAPEQCKDASAATAQSDAYALGVVLYEMLSGHPPFEATTRVELLTQHIRDTPPPLRRAREPIPPELRKLVMTLLAKTPAERPSLDRLCQTLRSRTSGRAKFLRWGLAAVGLAVVAGGAKSFGVEPIADWLVESELQHVQLEVGTIADGQHAVARAQRWLSIVAASNTASVPLARARVYHKSADISLQVGELSGARDGYAEALLFYQMALEHRLGEQAILRDRIAATSNELAQVLRHLGHDKEAAENFAKGIAEHDVLVQLPDQPERRKYLRTLVLYRQAELAADAGEPRASVLFAELRATLESLHEASPKNANVCWHLSRVLVAEAELWARSGNGGAARAQAERALHLVQEARKLAPNWRRPKIAEVEEARSRIYEAIGDSEAARASLHAAYSRWQETVAEEQRGAYRHEWLMVCLRGSQLQHGSLRDVYIQTANRLVSEFDREGIYQGDVHVSHARRWLTEHAAPLTASPRVHESPDASAPVQ